MSKRWPVFAETDHPSLQSSVHSLLYFSGVTEGAEQLTLIDSRGFTVQQPTTRPTQRPHPTLFPTLIIIEDSPDCNSSFLTLKNRSLLFVQVKSPAVSYKRTNQQQALSESSFISTNLRNVIWMDESWMDRQIITCNGGWMDGWIIEWITVHLSMPTPSLTKHFLSLSSLSSTCYY